MFYGVILLRMSKEAPGVVHQSRRTAQEHSPSLLLPSQVELAKVLSRLDHRNLVFEDLAEQPCNFHQDLCRISCLSLVSCPELHASRDSFPIAEIRLPLNLSYCLQECQYICDDCIMYKPGLLQLSLCSSLIERSAQAFASNIPTRRGYPEGATVSPFLLRLLRRRYRPRRGASRGGRTMPENPECGPASE